MEVLEDIYFKLGYIIFWIGWFLAVYIRDSYTLIEVGIGILIYGLWVLGIQIIWWYKYKCWIWQ